MHLVKIWYRRSNLGAVGGSTQQCCVLTSARYGKRLRSYVPGRIAVDWQRRKKAVFTFFLPEAILTGEGADSVLENQGFVAITDLDLGKTVMENTHIRKQ